MNKNLKTFQVIFNLSDSELSELLQIDFPTLKNYISGESLLPDHSINQIVNLYHVNRNWLLNAKGEMYWNDYPKTWELSSDLEEMIPILSEIPTEKWKILKVLIQILLSS